MKLSFLPVAALAVLSQVYCGPNSANTSQTMDVDFIGPVYEDQVPKDLVLIKTLDWPTKEQANDTGHVDEDDFDPQYDRSSLQQSWYDAFDPSKFCMQLVQSLSSKLVMIHNRPCPRDGRELLPNDELYIWMVVDPENGRDLYYQGYRVGSLLEKSVDDVYLHYVNDLCSYVDYSVTPRTGSSTLCSLAVVDGKILRISIKEQLRDPLIQLRGFKYSSDIPFRGKVEAVTCPEPIYDGVLRACTALGSRTSDACSEAGFQMLACSDCDHVCSANFLPAN